MIIGTEERDPQLPADLEAVGVGQAQVQENELRRRRRQGRRRRLHDGHLEAFPTKPYRQRLADGIVVFHHKDSHCPGSFPQPSRTEPVARTLGRSASTAAGRGHSTRMILLVESLPVAGRALGSAFVWSGLP